MEEPPDDEVAVAAPRAPLPSYVTEVAVERETRPPAPRREKVRSHHNRTPMTIALRCTVSRRLRQHRSHPRQPLTRAPRQAERGKPPSVARQPHMAHEPRASEAREPP